MHVPIDWLVVLDSADTNIAIVCKFVLSHYCKMRKLRGSVQLLAQEQKRTMMTMLGIQQERGVPSWWY